MLVIIIIQDIKYKMYYLVIMMHNVEIKIFLYMQIILILLLLQYDVSS